MQVRSHAPPDSDADPDPEPGADLARMVDRARAGDEAAFSMLYREVQPALLRYLRVLVGAEADDVASETWLHIARDLPTYRGDGGGFRAWAAGVARHRALDHLRRQGRRPSWPAAVENFVAVPAGDNTESEAITAVSTEAALALIATLPQDQAEAVMLRVVVGLDAESSARILGKRAGAVRTAAYRGLRRLARQLEDSVTPPGTTAPKDAR